MTEKAGRSELLDQLKGLGIVLVVIGHFIEPYRERFSIINSIFICIYAFHMPLFCLLSGMVAKFDVRYIYLPLALTRVVVFYVFFIVGYLYKDILLQLIKGQKSRICYLFSFIFLTILLAPIGINAEKINANILWEYLSYLEGGYTLLERLGFCAGAMAISLLICCINTLYKNSILVKLGKNTMSIYIFHAIFVKGFDQLEAITGMGQNIFFFAARLTTAAFVIFFLQSKPILRLTGKIWNFPMNRLK